MIEWLDEFYASDDLRDTLMRSFLPVFTSYVEAATGAPVAASFVQALAENYVQRHLGSSRAQLQEVIKDSDDPLAALTQRFDEWEEKRPGKVAKNELVRSANAAQVQQFRESGVTKMVWRTSGGCPFCRELDGTVISVEGSFFEAGDTLNPEGVEHPIHFESSLGHPPVHQGCVCSVEAVVESETDGEVVDTERVTELAADVEASNSRSSPRMQELARAAGLSPAEAERLSIQSAMWNTDTDSFGAVSLREAALRRGATDGGFTTHPSYQQSIGYLRANGTWIADADKVLDLSTAEVRRQLGTTGTVRVYRGIQVQNFEGLPNGPREGMTIDMAVEHRPLTSWTTSYDEALAFTNRGDGFPYLLEMDVPVTDVAGMAGTGLGNGAHAEVVLFGRAGQVARVTRPVASD